MPKRARIERRKHPRVKRVLCIHHRMHRPHTRFAEDSWHWHLSDTDNMSAGGLLFHSDVQYKIGDIIELKIVVSGVLDIYDGLAEVLRIENSKKPKIFPTAVKFLKTGKSNRKKK